MVCVELDDSVLSPRDEHLGRNETVFRELNERLASLASTFSWGPDEVFDLICECDDATCLERIRLTRSEYEAVREVPTHFAVFPAHAKAGIERVVSSHETYDIVEKDRPAGEVATRLSPR
ncbi:MAG: hypothetical protein QOH23_1840 [Gaiellaceae bacterium]|nr:hypothetical protein [Gaiellaceae bacterium]